MRSSSCARPSATTGMRQRPPCATISRTCRAAGGRRGPQILTLVRHEQAQRTATAEAEAELQSCLFIECLRSRRAAKFTIARPFNLS